MSYNVKFETENDNIIFEASNYYYQERIKNNIVEKIISFDINEKDIIERNKILLLSHENLRSIIVDENVLENNINKIPKVFTIEFSNLNLITNKIGHFINIIMNYSLSLGE